MPVFVSRYEKNQSTPFYYPNLRTGRLCLRGHFKSVFTYKQGNENILSYKETEE